MNLPMLATFALFYATVTSFNLLEFLDHSINVSLLPSNDQTGTTRFCDPLNPVNHRKTWMICTSSFQGEGNLLSQEIICFFNYREHILKLRNALYDFTPYFWSSRKEANLALPSQVKFPSDSLVFSIVVPSSESLVSIVM